MSHLEKALAYAHHNQAQFQKDLEELVTIPSISTSPEYKEEVRRGAEWLAKRLTALGMENVQILPTGGHPVVYADHLKACSLLAWFVQS